ncbi:enoyl-CoA hydratase/isomerase family protein [Pseudonocardia sp. McavD-2-B]|jgi:enoyl-CoA hydratase/carnithine racemase|uniref:enoyl-CoA hydratase/isomerase family protein n=1 Tax=Pseudonocardia sp. McavD-2-B TaxID=2954499 RepID=UPI0020977F8B|nr:enoyl-CoA hydratase/isomerase family protein [Pseudonocardia sp. McavD-2-B]MCO7192520.1 enoyl-CoA hydratase/isomerase family protein [Pseudonocardia sp. McavD-2-B]
MTPPYFDRYENLAFERSDDGVLTLRFHTDGGPITFTGTTHEDLPKALEDIAHDPDNRALVLTGTGDVFMDSIDGASLGEIFRPAHWEKIRREGLAVLQRLLGLPMPVIGVANGPATVHSEYLLLTDIHIASDRATYGDFPHPAFGITAGDGLQVVWEEAVGTARTKWLLWTGETVDAATALQWGVVNEVVPHEQAYARGLEIARTLAAKPALYRSLQKQTLNQRLLRRLIESVPYGMALEGLTAADLAYQAG